MVSHPKGIPMDFVKTQEELRLLTGKLIKLGRQYKTAREAFGEAKYTLDVELTPKQDDPKYQKASFEKQLLMLRNSTIKKNKSVIYGYHEDYIKQEQRYKGIEKLMEAIISRITTIQSLIRWQREND